MLNIYILELVNNKFYVGKTSKLVCERFTEHKSGKGSLWTKLYPPIRILKIIDNGDNFDEDKYTKLYMSMYGIDNVRGGTYITQYLSQQEKQFIQKEIWAATNVCTKCGYGTHFVSQCYAKKDINGNIIPTKNKNNFQPVKVTKIRPTDETIIDLANETKIDPTNEIIIDLADETKIDPTNEIIIDLADEIIIDLAGEIIIDPINETIIEPTNETIIEPTNETIIDPINETIIDPINEIIIEPINETVNEPANETIIEPVNEIMIEPTNETIVEPANETINKSVNKNTYLLNRGKKWTKEDEKYLFDLLISKKSIREISNLIGRTSTAIESRIATIVVRYCFDNSTNNILSSIIK